MSDAPEEATRLARAVVSRLRAPGPPEGRVRPARLGSVASASTRFVAGIGRPVPLRRMLSGPGERRIESYSESGVAPPRWVPMVADLIHRQYVSADVTPNDLPSRGLPRAARKVPNEQTWTPGGMLTTLISDVANVRRMDAVAAAGQMLWGDEKEKLAAAMARTAARSQAAREASSPPFRSYSGRKPRPDTPGSRPTGSQPSFGSAGFGGAPQPSAPRAAAPAFTSTTQSAAGQRTSVPTGAYSTAPGAPARSSAAAVNRSVSWRGGDQPGGLRGAEAGPVPVGGIIGRSVGLRSGPADGPAVGLLSAARHQVAASLNQARQRGEPRVRKADLLATPSPIPRGAPTVQRRFDAPTVRSAPSVAPGPVGAAPTVAPGPPRPVGAAPADASTSEAAQSRPALVAIPPVDPQRAGNPPVSVQRTVTPDVRAVEVSTADKVHREPDATVGEAPAGRHAAPPAPGAPMAAGTAADPSEPADAAMDTVTGLGRTVAGLPTALTVVPTPGPSEGGLAPLRRALAVPRALRPATRVGDAAPRPVSVPAMMLRAGQPDEISAASGARRVRGIAVAAMRTLREVVRTNAAARVAGPAVTPTSAPTSAGPRHARPDGAPPPTVLRFPTTPPAVVPIPAATPPPAPSVPAPSGAPRTSVPEPPALPTTAAAPTTPATPTDAGRATPPDTPARDVAVAPADVPRIARVSATQPGPATQPADAAPPGPDAAAATGLPLAPWGTAISWTAGGPATLRRALDGPRVLRPATRLAEAPSRPVGVPTAMRGAAPTAGAIPTAGPSTPAGRSGTQPAPAAERATLPARGLAVATLRSLAAVARRAGEIRPALAAQRLPSMGQQVGPAIAGAVSRVRAAAAGGGLVPAAGASDWAVRVGAQSATAQVVGDRGGLPSAVRRWSGATTPGDFQAEQMTTPAASYYSAAVPSHGSQAVPARALRRVAGGAVGGFEVIRPITARLLDGSRPMPGASPRQEMAAVRRLVRGAASSSSTSHAPAVPPATARPLPPGTRSAAATTGGRPGSGHAAPHGTTKDFGGVHPAPSQHSEFSPAAAASQLRLDAAGYVARRASMLLTGFHPDVPVQPPATVGIAGANVPQHVRDASAGRHRMTDAAPGVEARPAASGSSHTAFGASPPAFGAGPTTVRRRPLTPAPPRFSVRTGPSVPAVGQVGGDVTGTQAGHRAAPSGLLAQLVAAQATPIVQRKISSAVEPAAPGGAMSTSQPAHRVERPTVPAPRSILDSPRQLDELVDEVVERIEQRVIDELERRGRRQSPGAF